MLPYNVCHGHLQESVFPARVGPVFLHLFLSGQDPFLAASRTDGLVALPHSSFVSYPVWCGFFSLYHRSPVALLFRRAFFLIVVFFYSDIRSYSFCGFYFYLVPMLSGLSYTVHAVFCLLLGAYLGSWHMGIPSGLPCSLFSGPPFWGVLAFMCQPTALPLLVVNNDLSCCQRDSSVFRSRGFLVPLRRLLFLLRSVFPADCLRASRVSVLGVFRLACYSGPCFLPLFMVLRWAALPSAVLSLCPLLHVACRARLR